MDETLIIPYSFAPSVSNNNGRESDRIATTGITEDWNHIDRCLGDLYSVPSDGRIAFSFERNELRLKCAPGDITEYLKQTKNVFQQLHSTGGDISVQDYDLLGRSVYYSSSGTQLNRIAVTQKWPSYWKATSRSLYHEDRGLMIEPLRYAGSRCDPNTDGMLYKLKHTNIPEINRNWFRVVHFRGLTNIATSTISRPSLGIENATITKGGNGSSTRTDTMTYKELMDNILMTYALRDYRYIIREAFQVHFNCGHTQRRDNPFRTTWKPFNITWHEIIPVSRAPKLRDRSPWRYGLLYGSKGGQVLRETAFTMAMLPANQLWDPQISPSSMSSHHPNLEYWTIVLLTPPNCLYNEKSLENGLSIIQQGLDLAIRAWKELYIHFGQMLDAHDTILNPQEYDHLLFDDDTFSRSRLFFWAMDSLEVFINQIKDTVTEWENFWEAREGLIRFIEEKVWVRQNHVRRLRGDHPLPRYEPSNVRLHEILSGITILKEYQAHFENYQARTRTLREGVSRHLFKPLIPN